MSVEGSPAGDLADIDTEMKTSTYAALATGGGREDLHIHFGGGMRNQIFDFKAEMEVITCKEEGWKEIIYELPHCVTGAVSTPDVAYTGFYFFNNPESALY